MKKNKLLLSSVFLLILMSTVGYAVAHWSDSVTYTAEAHTGSMTLVHKKPYEPGMPTGYGEPYTELGINGDKDEQFGGPYSFGSWGLSDRFDDCLTGNYGYKTMWVKLENIYPGIVVARSVVIESIGTVPLHFNGINIYDPTGVMTWVWVVPFEAASANCEGFFYVDFNGNGQYDLEEAVMSIWFSHGSVIQLHEGEAFKGEFDIYFLQPLEECEEYYFEIQYLADQWNWVEGYPSVPPV